MYPLICSHVLLESEMSRFLFYVRKPDLDSLNYPIILKYV